MCLLQPHKMTALAKDEVDGRSYNNEVGDVKKYIDKKKNTQSVESVIS